MSSHPSYRQCLVAHRQQLSIRDVKRDILQLRDVERGFTLTATPAPARDDTWFKVYADRHNLLVAVAVFDSVGPAGGPVRSQKPNRHTVEIFFAPWNDRLGWFQFVFPPDGSMQTFTHLPYAAAHSTAFRYLKPVRHFWEQDKASLAHRLYWHFAWFPLAGVFRAGDACGFNVGRHNPPIEESSSWNHTAAVGFQDATTFGTLHLRKPARLKPVGLRLRPPTPKQARDFRFSVTYDIPDNIGFTTHYTPELIEREFVTWKNWGIDRLYWIEYGPFAAQVGLWRTLIGTCPGAIPSNITRTARACPDLLPVAARIAKRHGLDFIAVFKPFDLGCNISFAGDDPRHRRRYVQEIENRYVVAAPEIVAHPEYTMHAHPAWQREPRFPITRLRLYSQEPIPPVRPSNITLWSSADNQRFTKRNGTIRFGQGAEHRPHLRWTPAGNAAEPGRARNWFIEISGLDLAQPYLAIEIRGKQFRLTHRAFAFAEAWSGAEAAPLMLATSGNHRDGFQFGKHWPGWANATAPLLEEYTWNGPELGLVFRQLPNLPTMLEPAHAGSHAIWLRWIERMYRGGVDGVEIRTHGHHNNIASFLQYAFAEPVRAEFRRRFGREVEPTPADYARVRRIRGARYTDFLRAARTLAHRYRKKLNALVEWGADVGAEFDGRMQMPIEWERWIREGIVDEVSLRGWAAFNPFVRERLLPLSRRYRVPVHIISKNLPDGIDLRAHELVERWVLEACALGFGGYNLYEADQLLRLNDEHVPLGVGNTEAAVRRAAGALRELQRNPA
jgi:hypothetical protein